MNYLTITVQVEKREEYVKFYFESDLRGFGRRVFERAFRRSEGNVNSSFII